MFIEDADVIHIDEEPTHHDNGRGKKAKVCRTKSHFFHCEWTGEV